MVNKEIGHNFLARLGKKRLRPGGVEATKWLINQGNLTRDSLILEVACNMCTTSIELAKTYHCKIVAADLDSKVLEKANINIKKEGLEKYITTHKANALKLPFEDNTFDVIINEAMLTMLDNKAKEKAIKEYIRVLKPNGKLLTHDVSYIDINMADTIDKLKKTININVSPMDVKTWEDLFRGCGFSRISSKYGEMSLMSLKGMIRDEGLLNTLKIIKNGLKPENRKMFRSMFTFFNKTGKDLKYIAVCSQK